MYVLNFPSKLAMLSVRYLLYYQNYTHTTILNPTTVVTQYVSINIIIHKYCINFFMINKDSVSSIITLDYKILTGLLILYI